MSATPISNAKQAPASSLAAKLARVAAQLDRIPKNGRNQAQNYDYVTEGDVKDAVRRALAGEGVAIFPCVRDLQWREVQGRNGAIPVARVHVDFTVTDGAETMVVPFVGEGMDSGDKAIPKALTMALKYLFLVLFQISTGDDQDAEREDDAPPRRDNGAQAAAARGSYQAPPVVPASKQLVLDTPENAARQLADAILRLPEGPKDQAMAALVAMQAKITALPKDLQKGPREAYAEKKKRIEVGL